MERDLTAVLGTRPGPLRPQALRGFAAQGSSSPLGATPGPEGTNFSVFSKHATCIDLLLFDRVDDGAPAARVIRIDPTSNRTYHYWHVFVPGVTAGQIYGYRVEGPWDPANGMRFDPTKVLLDPYGRGVAVPDEYRRDAAVRTGDSSAAAMKSVVVDPGRRRSAAPAVRADDRVRDACARLHPPPQLRSK